ncbi:MAG: aldehyde dehydrogenase family protein [Gemmatimonadaceae bacterium]|nr:aldehyde dehydrogenase family protein [Gemmatimonadaceae bacterium]
MPLDAERETPGTGVVDTAIARARHAQAAWGARPIGERAVVLERFRRLLHARRAEVVTVISRETGKPPAEAAMSELATTLDLARFYLRVAPAHLTPRTLVPGSLALWRKRILITSIPYGTVAVIAPWNYPFMLPAGIVIPALVAGNAVLLKPSELTPSSGELLGELLHAAGIPNDILQVLPGDGTVGAALIQGAVDKVFFTGSVATGRRVAHACAERLIPCSVELGGSDPAVVLDDADIEHAASGITWGRFSNGGQTCVAPKRVFVVGDAYEPFVAAMRRRIEALQLGQPGAMAYDMGPLIQPSQHAVLAAQRDDAIERGARVEAVGDVAEADAIFPPTLLLDVPREARVLQEETFGPLLPIVRVADVAEAVAMANATPFGLSASVWSRDRRRARAVAGLLEAGTVVINDVTLVPGIAEVPHGGVKASGSGRSHGLAGLDECVRTRTIVDDLFTRWRQAWWFGYGEDAAARADAYLRLAHGRTLRERLSGVRKVLHLMFRPERPV